MNIVQISAMDNYGGAARVSWDLHVAYRENGHRSWMVVGQKFGNDLDVDLIPVRPPSRFRNTLYQWGEEVEKYKIELGNKNLGRFLKRLSKSEPLRAGNNYWGVEDFEYPGTWDLLDILKNKKPEVVHLHNLHANYFDLRTLPSLSFRYPIILTLHDAWLLSGHCAHSLDCERWKTGCGSCPYLSVSPPINRDATAFNWMRKRNIYAKSQVYVVSPSQWLLDKANHEKSILKPATVNSRVIPHGVDLSIFHPTSKSRVRQELQISKDAFVLLFVAAGSRESLSQKNLYKDYATIHAALEIVSKQMTGREVVFLALGGSVNEESRIGDTIIKFLPYVSDTAEIAKYYQAADVYLHAAYAETFGIVIVEALACGVPVIATGVGGISELIKDGVNGFLVNMLDAQLMSVRILELLNNDELRSSMGEQASLVAKKKWGLDRMVESYLSYYQEIVADWHNRT